MPTLAELLDDAQIADDMEIIFGDKGKYKLSDLRGVRKANRDKVDFELAAAKTKREELDRLATEAAKLLESMNTKGNNDDSSLATDDSINWDTDPVYAPVSKRLKPFEAKFTEILNTIEKLTKSFNDSATFVMTDFYERRWNTIPENIRPKDKTWRDYLKVANDRGYLNEYKLPDPVEAFNRERGPMVASDLQKTIDELTKKNTELAQQLESAPRMPRPGSQGSGGPTPHGEKADKVYSDVNSLVDDAFADPTIQNIISGGRSAQA